jgi:NAD(P)-dependent dehydrogenase (short-subunit alcohol dehydrogenase family)
MAGRFQGKTVFVTGASSGIGAAVALQLAREGAQIVLAARRQDRLAGVAESIERAGAAALPVVCDVCDRASIDAAVAEAVARFGGLDLVVANAGFYVDGIVQELTPEDYRAQMETNFFGVVETVYATLPHLRKSKGRLGIVSSVMGLMAMPSASAYCASKYALCGFGEAIYYDLAAEGISVTMINPGLVESEIRSKDNRGIDTGRPDPAPQSMVMPAEKAARLIVNALYKRRAQLILTNAAKMGDLLNRYAPAIGRMAFRYAGKKKLKKRLGRIKKGA